MNDGIHYLKYMAERTDSAYGTTKRLEKRPDWLSKTRKP